MNTSRFILLSVLLSAAPFLSSAREKELEPMITVLVQVDAVYPDGLNGCFSDGKSFTFTALHAVIVSDVYKGEKVRLAIDKGANGAGYKKGDSIRLKLTETLLKKHLADVKKPELAYVYLYERDCVLEKVKAETNGCGN